MAPLDFETYHPLLLIFPFDKRVMNKRIEDAHQRVLVIPEKLEGDLATLAECPFNACHAERVHDIWGKAERDALWCF